MALLPDYEDQVIKEGFLCPVCLEDFPGINELQAHFTSGVHDEKDADEQDSDSVSPAADLHSDLRDWSLPGVACVQSAGRSST